jgi:hypothetical protein
VPPFFPEFPACPALSLSPPVTHLRSQSEFEVPFRRLPAEPQLPRATMSIRQGVFCRRGPKVAFDIIDE